MSGSYTNWSGLTVPQIWAMLAGLDTGPQWTHVDGWQRAAELTGHHLTRMVEVRTRIAAAWPPERNEAARAYLTTLDTMIVSMRATHEAALANYGTIATTTAALDIARLKVKPLYDEYVANEQVLARPAVMPSPGRVPVTRARQEALALQARSIMVELSGTLAAAQYAVVTPPAYTAPRFVQDSVPIPSLTAPVIPPIGGRSGTAVGPAPAPPPTPRSPIGAPPVIGAPPGTAVPPATAGAPPSPGTVTTPVIRNRPLPPGGVIGAQVALGLAQPGGALSTPRVNPVGGVVSGSLPTIGGMAASPRPDNTTRTRSAPPLGRPAPPGSFLTSDGHRVSIRTSASSARRSDPDDPWVAADEGVPPVIAREAEPVRHDPGPAIGLTR